MTARIYQSALGTVKRKRNQARLVFTLEVECDMSKAPPWQTDAIDVLRSLDHDEVLDRLRNGKSLKPLGLKVVSDKVEMSK